MVVRVADCLQRTQAIDKVVIATSTRAEDDELARVATDFGLPVSRGPVDDIIARLHGVAREQGADYVVRVWGDCPLLDAQTVRAVLCMAIDENLAYASNCVYGRRSYPPGTDVEVFSRMALDSMNRDVTELRLREFPVEYVLARSDELPMRILQMQENLSDLHLTVDYEQDLQAVRAIYEVLGSRGRVPDLGTVLELLAERPDIGSQFSHAPRNIEYSRVVSELRSQN